MKLVKLKCPQCNANLEVNNDLTMAVCNYCGCSFYIDDEQVKQSQEATRKKKARENASHCLTHQNGYCFVFVFFDERFIVL